MVQPYLPPILKRGLNEYMTHGIQPGSFLLAVLTNDLLGACERADSTNLSLLPQIVCYLYNNVPHHIWGSAEKVTEHMVERQTIAEQMRLAAQSQPIGKEQAVA